MVAATAAANAFHIQFSPPADDGDRNTHDDQDDADPEVFPAERLRSAICRRFGSGRDGRAWCRGFVSPIPIAIVALWRWRGGRRAALWTQGEVRPDIAAVGDEDVPRYRLESCGAYREGVRGIRDDVLGVMPLDVRDDGSAHGATADLRTHDWDGCRREYVAGNGHGGVPATDIEENA